MYLRLPLHKYLPFLLKKTGEEKKKSKRYLQSIAKPAT